VKRKLGVDSSMDCTFKLGLVKNTILEKGLVLEVWK
jgi:hypothetical protein